MKRIFAALLCFCLLSAPCRPAVSVDGGFAASCAAPPLVGAGQEFELVYTFSSIGADGVCGIDLEIEFDAEKVEFVSVSLSGFPDGASWLAAGRTAGALYLLHVFDDYGSGVPVGIYPGSAASVRVRFRALKGVTGEARFSTEGPGAVQSCSFNEGGALTSVGRGDTVRVFISPLSEDLVLPLYALRGGVLCALPGCSAGDLDFEGAAVRGADGALKAAGDRLVSGDTLVFGGGLAEAPVILLCDLNADRRLTTTDYLVLKRHLAGGTVLSGAPFFAADINGDGVLSSADALYTAALLRGECPALCDMVL